MADPGETARALRTAQRVLFLAGAAAFSAALLVSHVLGPLTLWLMGGLPESGLWDPFLIGVALSLTGAPLAWLMARGFEMSPRSAAVAVGGLATVFLWTPTILAGGLEALWAVSWSFPLRLGLAGIAGRIAWRWACAGLPADAIVAIDRPYAAALDQTRPRVVILGGGFAGLSAARALAKAPVRVTLVDARNHHLFQPLLYQVATAALAPTAIASPLRRVLRGQVNAEVLMAKAIGVDLEARVLKLEGEALAYDRLIVATGSTDSYFGHEAWAAFAPGLKSLGQALDIRNRTLRAFEQAEREVDPERRAAFLTFVVVGAGPTGVELAGALSEIARATLDRDFRHIRPASARVILVEAGVRVLPHLQESLSARAAASLRALGVEVLTKTVVSDIDGDGVALEGEGGERHVAARTVMWAAGVRASPFGAALGVPLDRTGRVKVQPDLSLPGHPEVFVIGDLAAVEEGGQLVPALAPAAMQEGRLAAANIARGLAGRPALAFRYRDKGALATIGRWRAVGQLGRVQLSGFPAWLVWVFVHILYLIGFRNRYIVLSEWALAFLLHDRGARLIAEPADESAPPAGAGPSTPGAPPAPAG